MNLSRRAFLGLLSSAGAALAIQPGILIGDPDEIITVGEIHIGGNQWVALDGTVKGPARVFRIYVPPWDDLRPDPRLVQHGTFNRDESPWPIFEVPLDSRSGFTWAAAPGMEIVVLNGKSASFSNREIKSLILFTRERQGK